MVKIRRSYRQHINLSHRHLIFGAPRICRGVPFAELEFFFKEITREGAPPGADICLFVTEDPIASFVEANWIEDKNVSSNPD